MMSFEEIIYLMEIASDYIDLYDAASYIVDDDLRIDVEQLIGQCEDDGDSVEEAYSIVTSDLLDMRRYDLNEGLDITDTSRETVIDYIDLFNDASNDKDLLNIIENMDKNKSLDKDIVNNIRQLFKNNRYMKLNDKIETIVKYINGLDENVENKSESLNENFVSKDTGDDEDSSDNVDSEPDFKEDKKIKSALDGLKERVGQQFDVGEFNSFLQSMMNRYADVFLLKSDLFNKDLDKTQELKVLDDDITYILKYDIIDVGSGLIQLLDVSSENPDSEEE